ncbi:hypothetical protein ACJX0J_024679 [Zea mays]
MFRIPFTHLRTWLISDYPVWQMANLAVGAVAIMGFFIVKKIKALKTNRMNDYNIQILFFSGKYIVGDAKPIELLITLKQLFLVAHMSRLKITFLILSIPCVFYFLNNLSSSPIT